NEAFSLQIQQDTCIPLRQRHKYYHGVFYLKIYIARSFYLQKNKTPGSDNTKKNTIRIYNWDIIHV
ncbi:hypothetical protein, partial [Escherichia coli]|uniref:hypothetical protein n=1 Tax=Escherichia coli TaxID=562 RepID=UPI001BC83AF0